MTIDAKKTDFDYLILGAGPAGVQLGYYFERDGRDYQILERADIPGAFFAKFPRHGQLISINKVYTGTEDKELNMRHDWNSLLTDDHSVLFKDFSKEFFPPAETMLEYMQAYVQRNNIQIRYQTSITCVRRTEDGYALDTEDGTTLTCRQLIVATGVSKPFIPDIPGIELAEQYVDMSVNAEDFANQRVLIIGKGNSAFETADHLIPAASLIHMVSPCPIDFAWKTHYVGDLRAVNNNFLDTYQLKSQNAVLDAETLGIRKEADGTFKAQFAYKHAEGEVEELTYDRVLCCTGFRFDPSIFDDEAAPELAIYDKFPSLTCEWESTNQPNMFFVGTLMQMRDYKKSTSGFIHGFRYNVEAFHKLLAHRFHNEDLPHTEHPLLANVIVKRLLGRINGSSSLWQQHGFLGDCIVVNNDETEVEYYEGLPLAFLQKQFIDQDKRCFVLTLEFGTMTEDVDPFRIDRIRKDNVAKAASSVFLHPAIREYELGAKVSEHHVIEDLEAVWNEAEHIDPLTNYMTTRIRSTENRVAFE